MPLTAGRRQRVKFVNYVNFNWPSLLFPPTLPLSMPFTTYVTCQKCSLLQGDPSTSSPSPFPSTLPACLPLKVLRLWLRVVFHKLLAASVDSPMWHVAPAPSPSLLCVIVCHTHTCSLPLSHSLSLSLCLCNASQCRHMCATNCVCRFWILRLHFRCTVGIDIHAWVRGGLPSEIREGVANVDSISNRADAQSQSQI